MRGLLFVNMSHCSASCGSNFAVFPVACAKTSIIYRVSQRHEVLPSHKGVFKACPCVRYLLYFVSDYFCFFLEQVYLVHPKRIVRQIVERFLFEN